jgi:hypothetical protein
MLQDKSQSLFMAKRELPQKRRSGGSSNSELMEFAKEIDNQAIMIAFSGFVDDNVRLKCEEAGFQLVIDTPLSVQKVQELIIPLLE